MAGQWQPGMAWADADSDDEQPRPMKPKVAPGNNQQMQNQNQQQNQQGQQQMMMMPMGMPMMGQQQQPMMGQPMMGQQQPMMMMPMGMQQGQQMMMPMGMGQQMMMPMAMAGQQGQQMPMMMMVMPNGQPMMQGQQMMQQQPVAWAGQQMCQPAPAPANNDNSSGDAAPKTVGAKAKESKRGSKLKNGKLGGNSDTPKVDNDACDGSGSVSSEKPTEASQSETPTTPCKEKALRHALLQRQASEVVQRLRQSGARRAGLADTAAQLRHSTFSALNLEVSSSSRRNSTAVHPLRRQSLAEFQRELKEAQKKKEASEKAAMISLPPGSWNKAKTECVSSPSASTRASGEEADVDGLAEFDNLVAA